MDLLAKCVVQWLGKLILTTKLVVRRDYILDIRSTRRWVGTDDASNLRAICSVCNEGAKNLTLPRPDWLKLSAQIRRAPGDVQLKALDWLIGKFPDQAKIFHAKKK